MIKSLKTLVCVHCEKETYIKNFFNVGSSDLIKVVHHSVSTDVFRGDNLIEVHLLDNSDILINGICKIHASSGQLFVLEKLFDKTSMQLEFEESTDEDKAIIKINTNVFERNRKIFYRLIKFIALANIYSCSYHGVDSNYLDRQENYLSCYLEFEKDIEFKFISFLEENDTVYYLNRWYEIFTRKISNERKYTIELSQNELILIYFSKDKNFEFFGYKLNKIIFNMGKFSDVGKKVYLVLLMNFGFRYMENTNPRNLAELTLEFVDLVGNVEMDFFEGYQHQLVA